MTQKKQHSSVDYSKIRFPSDELTIEEIRQRHPKASQVFAEHDRTSCHWEASDAGLFDLAKMFFQERQIANDVGRNLPSSAQSARLKILNEEYCKFGLSKGEATTRELIRSIESQASNNALAI